MWTCRRGAVLSLSAVNTDAMRGNCTAADGVNAAGAAGVDPTLAENVVSSPQMRQRSRQRRLSTPLRPQFRWRAANPLSSGDVNGTTANLLWIQLYRVS